MSEKCGCVFCRGDLAYVMENGAELRITAEGTVTVRVPLASVAAQAERGQQLGDIVVRAGKLFDRCPTCGRQLANRTAHDVSDISLPPCATGEAVDPACEWWNSKEGHIWRADISNAKLMMATAAKRAGTSGSAIPRGRYGLSEPR